MKIVVCVRQGLDGEISPFDGAAYEAALRISGAEVTLLSMGPASAKDFLFRLSRLGAKRAVLLSDSAFAGADTLATAYTLSMALKRLQPDFVFCGRQTLIGDTAQTGAMLSVLYGASLATNVMHISSSDDEKILCSTRENGEKTLHAPALLSFERIYALRLPSIRSRAQDVEIWSSSDINADTSRCGLRGSPTRVLEAKENISGKRKCKFITIDDLETAVNSGLSKARQPVFNAPVSEKRLASVLSIGKEALPYAESVCDNVTLCESIEADEICRIIQESGYDAVLFPSSASGREAAACVAAKLSLGLCADCTTLETDGETLYMIRPASAGSIMAKVKSLTRPAMATVRTSSESNADIIVAAGYGARGALSEIESLAKHFSADIAASRKAVDADILPYSAQVGLTGKSVSSSVYIAVGISGAVHHIVGMQRSGTVIAINPDKDAPIFEYADYGIIANAENLPCFD